MEQPSPEVPNRFSDSKAHRRLGREPRGQGRDRSKPEDQCPIKTSSAPPAPQLDPLLPRENVSQHCQIFQFCRRSRLSGLLCETCQFLNVGKE